jgi:hypothetical protein
MQEYPEVHSLEESLAILKKYKSELTREQYEQIKSVIGNHAIESIYSNERDILLMVDMQKNSLSFDEALARAKARGDL